MRQTVYIIILAALVLGTGYLWYNYSGSVSDTEKAQTENSGTRLTELRRLKTLQLDISVLKDPLFGVLIPPAEILPTGAVQPIPGRTNPFLPF